MRIALALSALCLMSGVAMADDVFDVCKGESKHVVEGTGQMSISIVYPDDFPATTTPTQRNAVAAVIAKKEKAKIVPNVDTEAAKKLVANKTWKDKGDVCDLAPGLVAVLGQKHKNLSTATISVECDASDKCVMHIDLERHGKSSAERYVRYDEPLTGDKTKTKTYQTSAKNIKLVGETPNHPQEGLAVTALPLGKVTVRSDVDGALEADKIMESSPAYAACRPSARKAADIRGYYAEWMLTAKGGTYQVAVKPFAGKDPSDQTVSDCLKKAIEATKVGCPRDAKPVAVKTSICL